jgi:5-formaminoimidazole-4-carboxamide-1-(beta)-D-ribofuranosyl 5'-monophosphate synthetase
MALAREEIRSLVERYPRPPVLACVGSHSALDVADGAVSEGFESLVLAQAGRDATYSRYFRTVRGPGGERVRGCVDEV